MISKVRIGPSLFPVYLESEDSDGFGDTYGFFDSDEGIRLHPDQLPTEMAQTLLHECIHGIYHVYKLPSKLTEEQACLRLEGPLLAFLRDNPEVVAAIQDTALKGTPLAVAPASE